MNKIISANEEAILSRTITALGVAIRDWGKTELKPRQIFELIKLREHVKHDELEALLNLSRDRRKTERIKKEADEFKEKLVEMLA